MKVSNIHGVIKAVLWVSAVVAFVAGSLLIASCQQKQEMSQSAEVASSPQSMPEMTNNDSETAISAANEETAEIISSLENEESGSSAAEESTGAAGADIAAREKAAATEYAVMAGDDLWGISRKFYHTHVYWNMLAGWNGLKDPAILRPGQKLQIPPVTEFPYQLYLVREGDNLHGISRAFYDTDRHWKSLAKANRLANVDRIEAGMILRIPHVEEIAGKTGRDSTLLAVDAGS